MNYLDLSQRALVGAIGLCLWTTGCIITTSDDDGLAASSDDGNPPNPDTGQPSSSTGPGADSTDTAAPPDTTGGPVGECTDNLVLDPGFEAGTPSDVWTEASTVFGTPICDASCTMEEGAEPYAGDWWLWLGGVEDEPEDASVAQTITIPPDTAYLSFQFQIRSGAGTGDDVFAVVLGGDTVFMVSDLDMTDYDTYTRVDVDVSAWADGGDYELRFSSQHAGTGLTSFFVDEVSLVSCSDGETGDTTVGQDTTAGTDSGSSGETGTTGGSTTGGGSSSSGG